MTRAELIVMVVNMVAKGHLTYVEARAVITAYDKGTLPRIRRLSMADILSAFGLLSRLGPPGPMSMDIKPGFPAWQAAQIKIRLKFKRPRGSKLSKAESKEAQSDLRTEFEKTAQTLAIQVRGGGIDPQRWQENMAVAVSSYAVQMAVAGAGKLPGQPVQVRVESELAKQSDFLLRFTVQIAARDLVERPMSVVQISARAQMYGDVGWGAFFQGQGDDPLFGYVERWITRDDNMVCRFCRPRHGQIFLPGEGPMPGWDCLGVCRCQRRLEFNPKEYIRLKGGALIPQTAPLLQRNPA